MLFEKWIFDNDQLVPADDRRKCAAMTSTQLMEKQQSAERRDIISEETCHDLEITYYDMTNNR